jgi:hypothetical protein
MNVTSTQFSDMQALSARKITRGVAYNNVAIDLHLMEVFALPNSLPPGLAMSFNGFELEPGDLTLTLIAGRPLLAGSFTIENSIVVRWHNPFRPLNAMFPPVHFNIFPAMVVDRLKLSVTANRSFLTPLRRVTGGRPPIVFELMGSLPPGLDFNNATGQISVSI